MELNFHRWGELLQNSEPNSEKLILLHGMGGTGALWRPIAASLENRYSIMAMDQRGHGKSRGSLEGYSPLDFGRDVVETVEKTGFHPAWLVGHSMGVRTACAAAHLRPELFRGLILVDLGFSGVAGGGLGEGLANFVRILPTQFASRAEARDFMNQNCPDPSIAQYLMAVSVSTAGTGVTFPFDHDALVRTIESARNVSIRPWVRELGKAGKPVLILRGEKSSVWTHEEFEEERKQFADLPSVQFEEFQGTGHGLPFEKRAEFVARLDRLIQSSR